MSIPFVCPHCGTQMEILERFAGQSGPCAICAGAITIPASHGGPGDPNPPPGDLHRPAEGLTLTAALAFLGGSAGIFCIGFLIVVMVVRVALPAFHQSQADRLNGRSLRNLEKIAAALNQYHDAHGAYPPAYFVDEAGQPAHSWRVLILPQLGYADLDAKYDFSQAWDSDNNLMVMRQMPREYGSPRNASQGVTDTTHFAVVTGKQTAFPYEQSVSRSQVLDEKSTVLAVVEVHGIGFDWTDPATNYDLGSSQGTLVIVNELNPTTPLSASTLTGNVAMLGGEVRHLEATLPPQVLRDMATRSGSEFIDPLFDPALQP